MQKSCFTVEQIIIHFFTILKTFLPAKGSHFVSKVTVKQDSCFISRITSLLHDILLLWKDGLSGGRGQSARRDIYDGPNEWISLY